MSKDTISILESYLEDAKDIRSLRAGLYFVTWDYIQRNIDTGLDSRINGAFIADFISLLEILQVFHKLTIKPANE